MSTVTFIADGDNEGLVSTQLTLNDIQSQQGSIDSLREDHTLNLLDNDDGVIYVGFTNNYKVYQESDGLIKIRVYNSSTSGTPTTVNFTVSGPGSAVVSPTNVYTLEILNNDPSPAWWDAQWTKRVQVSFNNTEQATTLTDFPVLV